MHWARILRNILSNWTSYLVTAVVGFVLAPIVVHSLGNTGYGLWTLVLSMTGYFGLLDLGIRSSVGRFVTRHLTLNDVESVNRTASAAFVILLCGAAVAFLTTVAIATFFFSSLPIEPQYASAGRAALLITGLNMSCILPLGVFSAILIGMERFDVVSGVSVVGELSRAALVIWFLHHGYGLVALAVIALAVTLAQYALMACFAKGLYRPLRLSVSYVDIATARSLFGFSIYRFTWIIANQLIFYSDSVVIAFLLGVSAVTPYAIAGSLINYGRNIVSLMTDPFAPSAARMDATNDIEGLQRLLVVGTRVALFAAVPICLGFLFLGRQFITLWMGNAYASSAVLLTILTIPQIGSMSQYPSAFILAGMAKHRTLAYVALAEGVSNLILSIVLARKIGVVGVAWGTVIPHLICSSVVVPLYTLHVLRMRVRDYLINAFARPTLCALPVVALGYRFSLAESASWFSFTAKAMAMCATFAVIAYFFCLDARQRAAAVVKVGSIFRRQAVLHEA